MPCNVFSMYSAYWPWRVWSLPWGLHAENEISFTKCLKAGGDEERGIMGNFALNMHALHVCAESDVNPQTADSPVFIWFELQVP